jgi:outer membrane protein OmpA-like peptidoglycan-associated protein
MKPSSILAALALTVALAPLPVRGETTEDLVNKLQGQAKAGAGGKTRGFVPRGSKPAVTTERRSVRFSGRGIPKNIQVTDKGNVQVKEVAPAADGEPAYELSYTVDPESKVTRTSILFVKDSTEFADGNSTIELAKLAQAFKDPKLAGHSFVIEGHSSAEGSTGHNQELSQERAAAIVAELVGYGVSPNQLVPAGFGESKAQHEEYAPEALRAQDRRVEVYRLE